MKEKRWAYLEGEEGLGKSCSGFVAMLVKGVFQGYSTLAPMSGICRIDHVPSL
jgi:hypothetical protein